MGKRADGKERKDKKRLGEAERAVWEHELKKEMETDRARLTNFLVGAANLRPAVIWVFFTTLPYLE